MFLDSYSIQLEVSRYIIGVMWCKFDKDCTFLTLLMRRSNCSAPIPPGHPRGHHFFCCCPWVLITLIFTCPSLLINHQNHPLFKCPSLFYQTHISLTPGLPVGGGWEQKNLTGALCIIHDLMTKSV